MKYFHHCFLVFSLLILFFQGKSENIISISEDVKLASVFGTHMVLQQNEPINIWGEAAPKTEIQAQLGSVIRVTIADKQGN